MYYILSTITRIWLADPKYKYERNENKRYIENQEGRADGIHTGTSPFSKLCGVEIMKRVLKLWWLHTPSDTSNVFHYSGQE